MNSFFTFDHVSIVCLMFGQIFQAFLYFKDPQDDLKKEVAVLKENVKEVIKEVLDIKQTNIVTINKNVSDLTTNVGKLENSVVKLTTIIDERIPKKV